MTSNAGGDGREGDPILDPGEAPATGASIFDNDEVVASTLESYGDTTDEEAGPVSDPPAVPAAADALSGIADVLAGLAAGQDELRELFESKIRSDETQAKALERLHDQLCDYKANFVRQQMLPLLRDLIYCYDVADDEAARARQSGPAATGEEAGRGFDHLKQMVADVLAKYDVEPFRVAGPEFDRREQQCVRTVPTASADDDKKVASVGATGFRLAELIIRKEQVTVYKYTPGSRAHEASVASEAS